MKTERIEPASSTLTTVYPQSDRGMHLVSVAALLLLIAVCLRAGLYGDALIGDDEQFYLLVGDRMLKGVMPYIGIFDRKPFGLFALFAGMRALDWSNAGNGLILSQLLGTLAAAGTALAIVAATMRRVGVVPAILAGVFYLAMLEPFGGGSTQAPIFFNLLTAVSGWLVLGTAPGLDLPGDQRRVFGAMLLCGLAVQIKINVAFEAVAIGLWLAVRLWRSRSTGEPVARVGAIIGTMVALGLLPTILVGGGYALAGHFSAWWFANFQSQFGKTGGFDAESFTRLSDLLHQGAPVLFTCIAGPLLMPPGERRWLLASWTVMAMVEAFSIGNFWTHYLLPAAVVGSLNAATVFSRQRWGRWAFVALAGPAMLITILSTWHDGWVEQREAAAVLKAIPTDVSTTCMLTYDSPVTYLQLSKACLVTPYIFVDEFRSAAEAHALPEDATVAFRAALARRPGTIMTVARSHWRNRNHVNDVLMHMTLMHSYHCIAILPRDKSMHGQEAIMLWRRNDLPLPKVMGPRQWPDNFTI